MKTNKKAFTIVLIVLAVTLATISASSFALGAINAAAQNPAATGTNGHSNWMSGDQWNSMLVNMMGGNWGSPSSTPTPVTTVAQNSILPLIGFITLIIAALTGTGGAVYFFTGRQKLFFSQPAVSAVADIQSVNVEKPYDSVSKTLTTDERKVVDVLTSHNGQYLQKYIRTETGLSRLKIHRVVNRLAERGIVTLEQSGNTNKVFVSSWLATQPFSKIKPKAKVEKEMVIEE